MRHAPDPNPDQGDLFVAPATAGSVRASDPQTSADAAALVDSRRRCTEVLAALRVAARRHGGGATPFEIEHQLAEHGIVMASNVISRRLLDLEGTGLVLRTDQRRPGASHRNQTVWSPTTTNPEQGATCP